MPWCEKYRGKCFADIRGQDLAIAKIKEFVQNFNNPEKASAKRAIILHGPPGTGKTSLAHALSHELNYEIFELNASDLRNKKRLEAVLRPAVEQQSLTSTGKIILVDEVDGLSATDRGGLPELLSLIDETNFPIVITANDIWNRKFSSLRRKAELIKLSEIDYKIIRGILFDILRKENLFLNKNIVTSIAIKAKGDIRAAINDLQTLAHTPAPEISVEELHERNKEQDIFNALKQVFKNKAEKNILYTFNEVNMSMDEIILWLEENIPKEYQGEELAKAYDALSKADIFRRRIYKRQYWRFMAYENIFITGGISAAKKQPKSNKEFTRYKKPDRILKIWLYKQKNAKKKTICKKYAKYVHVGHKRAMREFPIIKQILKNHQTRQELKLTDDEIAYLDR